MFTHSPICQDGYILIYPSKSLLVFFQSPLIQNCVVQIIFYGKATPGSLSILGSYEPCYLIVIKKTTFPLLEIINFSSPLFKNWMSCQSPAPYWDFKGPVHIVVTLLSSNVQLPHWMKKIIFLYAQFYAWFYNVSFYHNNHWTLLYMICYKWPVWVGPLQIAYSWVVVGFWTYHYMRKEEASLMKWEMF